jgi:hypothetical protein
MSFLDELPLDETRPEFTELLDLLITAYPSQGEAKAIAFKSGLHKGRFPHQFDPYGTWRELIQRMRVQGCLRDLVENARDDPDREGLKPQFEAMLSGSPAIRTPEPEMVARGMGVERTTPEPPAPSEPLGGGYEGVVESLIVAERARLRRLLDDALKDPTAEELGRGVGTVQGDVSAGGDG